MELVLKRQVALHGTGNMFPFYASVICYVASLAPANRVVTPKFVALHVQIELDWAGSRP